MKGQKFAVIDQAEDGIRGGRILGLFAIFDLDDVGLYPVSFLYRILNFTDGFRDVRALIGPEDGQTFFVLF